MGALRVEECWVETHAGPRRVLVASPADDVVLGHADLARLASDPAPSPRDREMLKLLDGQKVDVFVFRAQDGKAPGGWRFDDALSDIECSELGFHLARSHGFLHRGLAAAGVAMAVCAGLEFRELEALRRGNARFVEEIGQRLPCMSGRRQLIAEADVFIARHMMIYTSLKMDRLLSRVIPEQLPLCERRAPKVDQMRERVSMFDRLLAS